MKANIALYAFLGLMLLGSLLILPAPPVNALVAITPTNFQAATPISTAPVRYYNASELFTKIAPQAINYDATPFLNNDGQLNNKMIMSLAGGGGYGLTFLEILNRAGVASFLLGAAILFIIALWIRKRTADAAGKVNGLISTQISKSERLNALFNKATNFRNFYNNGRSEFKSFRRRR